MCGPQVSTTAFSPSRTVGFLGFGRIAQATLDRLVAFGIANYLYSSSPGSLPKSKVEAILKKRHPTLREVRQVNLDELACQSDVLFILAPGGPDTHHVINEPFLRKMKKHAVLVNPSRGTLVDSDALAKALREKWIWGAGVDVVEGEPNVGLDHPLVKEPRCAKGFTTSSLVADIVHLRCVVLPHIGSATIETRLGMATLAARNLIAALLGGDMLSELSR